MILNERQIQQVKDETGATALSPDHPSYSELESNFGEHTFFFDSGGLYVWERLSNAKSNSKKLVGIRLAAWYDEKRSALIPLDPATTQVIQETD